MIRMKIYNSGQSLFEVVVAIGIVSGILVGIISLATHSVNNSIFSRDKSQAQVYTQEALEWLRGQRDMGWDSFASHSNGSGITWCMDNLAWGNSGPCGSNETISSTNFRRQAELKTESPDEIFITVSTIWESGGRSHKAQASTKLNNWK